MEQLKTHIKKRDELLNYLGSNFDMFNDRSVEAIRMITEYIHTEDKTIRDLVFKLNTRIKFNEDVKERPKWHKVTSHYKGDEKYLINLPLDNGKEIQMTCPWVGYFEALYGAEIISEDNDMKFETGER